MTDRSACVPASHTIPETRTSLGSGRVVPFAVPFLDEDDVEGVVEVLRSGWITTGPRVRSFESAFAERLGMKHAIAVCSATAALHLSLDALGLQAGDEVLVPDITFTATAEVVRYFDATPVLVDVLPETLCLDPEAARRAVTPRTRAIIPVHLGGHPAPMHALIDLAGEHDLVVIEDAAHAFPCRYDGQEIGTLGHMSAFSFYATKTITTGEGGMLVTNDDEWADRARVMALHGMSRDAWKRYTRGGSWRYDVIAPGFKYNMTDIAASLGLTQLAKVDDMWNRRRAIAARYTEAFSALPELQTPPAADSAGDQESVPIEHSWHLYVLRLQEDRLDLDRDSFLRALDERGVMTSVHFIPVHSFTYYRSTYGYRDEAFPVATREFERMFSLPIYPSMTADDVEHVIAAVTDVVERHRR
jgi:dTDP-4-amino-4,6-dideoxygalactose transaminase